MNFEEWISRVTSDQDRMAVSQEVATHRLVQFVDSLDPEQLETFGLLMSGLAHQQGDSVRTAAASISGVVAGVRHSKQNVCWGCGRDHDTALAEQIEGSR